MNPMPSATSCWIMPRITPSPRSDAVCSSLRSAAACLTSEGETWRRHRRIMAPAFDPRSIVGYAPIMTRMTEQSAGEMGRAACPARARRCRSDDGIDAAHHLERDVLVRFRRNRRFGRARRQHLSDEGTAQSARSAAFPDLALATACTAADENLQRVRSKSRSPADGARQTAGRRAEGFVGSLDCRARQRNRRRNVAEGGARSGGHHLHGRARNHLAGADLDLLSAVTTSRGRGQAPCRTRGRPRRPHTGQSGRRQACVTRAW